MWIIILIYWGAQMHMRKGKKGERDYKSLTTLRNKFRSFKKICLSLGNIPMIIYIYIESNKFF